MSNRFARLATSGTVVATIVAGSLFLAPAADAATHKVTAGYSSQSETVKVGTHKDKLTLKKASSSVTLIAKATKDEKAIYVPSYYTVTLTNAKSHKLFTKKVSAWRGLNAFLETESHTYKTDAALTKQVKHDVAVSNAAAKKSYNSILARLNAEGGLAFITFFAAAEVVGWQQQNPTETTFDNLIAGDPSLKTTLTGAPQDFTLVETEPTTGITVTMHIVGNDLSKATGKFSGPVVYGTFKQGNQTTTITKK